MNVQAGTTGRNRQATSLSYFLQLIHHAADALDGLPGKGVTRLDLQRFLKQLARAGDHSLCEIHAAEIEIRELPRFVTLGLNGLLEPGNRLVVAPEVDQVRPNIIVGIAEIGIDSDGALALGDGFVDFALEVIGPAEERMRLRCGMKRQ